MTVIVVSGRLEDGRIALETALGLAREIEDIRARARARRLLGENRTNAFDHLEWLRDQLPEEAPSRRPGDPTFPRLVLGTDASG